MRCRHQTHSREKEGKGKNPLFRIRHRRKNRKGKKRSKKKRNHQRNDHKGIRVSGERAERKRGRGPSYQVQVPGSGSGSGQGQDPVSRSHTNEKEKKRNGEVRRGQDSAKCLSLEGGRLGAGSGRVSSLQQDVRRASWLWGLRDIRTLFAFLFIIITLNIIAIPFFSLVFSSILLCSSGFRRGYSAWYFCPSRPIFIRSRHLFLFIGVPSMENSQLATAVYLSQVQGKPTQPPPEYTENECKGSVPGTRPKQIASSPRGMESTHGP